MSARFEEAKLILLSLTDVELERLGLPRHSLIRRTVRYFEDESTSLGLDDLHSEERVVTTLGELEDDLHELLGRDGDG